MKWNIIMVCRASLFFYLVMQTISAQLDISFMRFYKSDKDFISDVRLLATARFYQSHLQVFYDLNKNRANYLKKKYKVGKVYSSLNSLLKDKLIDIVDICIF